MKLIDGCFGNNVGCSGHNVVALLLCAFINFGCSSSGESSSTQSQASDDSQSIEQNQTETTLEEPETVVPDPLVQNSTTVTFEIRVPAYQSNALQVRVEWGDIDVNADWVGDESWTISSRFPTDTAHQLTVWFFDENGAVVLGQYQEDFKTGTNSAESYEVNSDQFDTASWDADNDGVSNLAELIAGTNPDVDEFDSIDVVESFQLISLLSDQPEYFESLVPAGRPYFQNTEVSLPVEFDPSVDNLISSVTIDIDEFGTGSYLEDTQSYKPPYSTYTDRVATRTKTENSIVWSGSEEIYFTGSGYRQVAEFTREVSSINASTRSQQAEISIDRSNGGDSIISYTLVGELIEGSSYCEPVSGSVTVNYYATPNVITSTTVITKESTDRYWMRADGAYAKNLGFTFWCTHADLE